MKCLAALSLVLVGCIRVPQARLGDAPSPPPSPAKVAACEATRNRHNAWVITGTVLGGAAGVQGGIDAATTNKTAQTGVAIGVAVAGVMAAVSTAVAGMESDNYSTNNCQAILSAAAAQP